MPGRDFNPQTGAQWFSGENDGATFRFFRKPGVATGRVLDLSGTPVPGLDLYLFGNCYVYCGETTTDAAGRYRFDGLVPWTRYRLEFSNVDPDEHEFIATEGTLIRPRPRMNDAAAVGRLHLVAKRRQARRRRLAKDDIGVAKIRVAVRDLGTGNGCEPAGGWGAYRLVAASATDPGARRTDWRFKRASAAGAVRRLAGRGRHGRPAQRRAPSVARRHRPALIPAGEVVSRSDTPA